MRQPNDQYSRLSPPFRDPVMDASGEGIAPVWRRHLTEVASKAGRSMVWRGAWTKGATYQINDVVSDAEKLWCALAQNANQKPASDDKVWSLVLGGGSGPGSVPIATSSTVGTVKPDNTTITVDGAGTISTIGGVTLPIAESDVTGLVADLAGKVPTTRTVSTTAPLTGGGDLSANRTIAIAASISAGVLGIVIDGGAAPPATGSKGFLQVPYACVINSWTMIADQSGSAQITVKKSTYSGFPTTASIVASAQPKLTSAQKNTSSTLTGWTTTLAAGDILEFNLDSVTTCLRLILELQVSKT